ncbi:MAG: winged helix-turn-helix domain-containing protein [Anaerolineae bacterium]|jgi:DNA-binding winged helix-turn-helix (wHTH) protein
MLPNTLRQDDGAYILQRIADGDCCALVGVSNTGKSYLLRTVAQPDVQRHVSDLDVDNHVFAYVDFNLMLEATEQGFYELILRCLMEELQQRDPEAAYVQRLQNAYQTLVAPPSAFQISLSFSEGLTAVCQGTPRNLVLLFDEFDEPYEQIDGRVFLNLRALKDKYRQRLSFVTATNRRLSNIRRGRDVDEFVELFEPFTRFLRPLSRPDVNEVITWVAAQEGYTFDDEDRGFVYHHADGHLGLLLSICRALGEVTGEPVRDPSQDWLIHRQVRERLDREINVQGECRKLWDDLTESQQDTLIAVVGAEEEVDAQALESLRNKGVVHQGEDLLFSPVMESFVRRQRLRRRHRVEGVRVDVDSGTVWVDGHETPTLTDLEYRLLLLLYGQLNNICDKYQIVEAVWGEEYIEQVDDARIDKLLSRLRAKIEPDPRNPRYIVTVRGRGYRLVTP